MENKMWDQIQKGLGSDGTITSLAKGKQRKGSIVWGHSGLINDVETVFVDKTDPAEPARREEFWRNILKTLAPCGIHVEE